MGDQEGTEPPTPAPSVRIISRFCSSSKMYLSNALGPFCFFSSSSSSSGPMRDASSVSRCCSPAFSCAISHRTRFSSSDISAQRCCCCWRRSCWV